MIKMKDSFRPSGKNYLHVNNEPILKIDKEYMDYLKSLVHKDKDNKCTMCLHHDIRERVHEMINMYPKFAYVRPHSHPFKTETKIIIEGKMAVIIFNDQGKVIDQFIMEKQGVFIFRLDRGIIHMSIPLTDVAFYEVTEGSFTGKGDSIFPEWAPLPEDVEEIERLMSRIDLRKL